MNIRAIGNNTIYESKTRTRSDKEIFTTPLSENAVEESPLEYYKKLCREFPDITFRLSDKETALKTQTQDNVYLGYNNSMNQIGQNFGKPGQCSIDIDISVLEKMQKDERYEMRVKGMIENSKDMYSVYERQARQDGYMYISVVIADENGRPTKGIMNSNIPYSTEEEVKKLWSDTSHSNQIKIEFENIKNSLLEQYLSWLDERDSKLSRLGIDT